MSALTGSFDTSELPKLGSGPVTVTVARDVAPGFEPEFNATVRRFEAALLSFPGCLGVGVLRPGFDDGPSQIVFRFTDPVSLRRWERSPERAAILAELDPFVVGTRVQRVHGVERFFDLPELAGPDRAAWKSFVSDVAWVSPASLVVSVAVAPHWDGFPLLARVVLGVAVMTALIAFGLTPVRQRLRRRRA